MSKRISHNLARNKITQRPISLVSVATTLGLINRPVSLSDLWSRLVRTPLAPTIKVETVNVETLGGISSPNVQGTEVTIKDVGHGTIGAADNLDFTIFRDHQQIGASNFVAGEGLFVGGSARTAADFEMDVSFSLEAAALNDAGSAVSRQTVLFRRNVTQPPAQARPSIGFDRGQSKLTGSGFKVGDVVFIRVQIRGSFGIRDSSQLSTGLPSTTADNQGRIDTPLDIRTAVPPVVDNTTEPPTTLAGCASGETVAVTAHDSRRDPQSPSNDFLWSDVFQFTC